MAGPDPVGSPDVVATRLLSGKVVLVSGIGPGLGRSIAVRSAAAGADVVLAARTQSTLDDVAREVEALGVRALPVVTDIDDGEAVENLANTARAEFGGVDALVNNAFAMPPMKDLADISLRRLRAGFETNVLSTLGLTRSLIPSLVERGGSVVMINSMVVRHSESLYGGYKMTKAALLSMAQSLATELGPRGVRVNSIAPGYIWAEGLEEYFAALAEQRGVPSRQVYDEHAAGTDLRRLPDADSIADTAVFLASDLARSVTGQCLDVNCGEHHH